MKATHLLLIVLMTVGLASCGGGGAKTTSSPPPSSSTVAISVSPSSASVNQGATQQFTVSVTGTTNTAVTWSVQETNGGSVTAAGLYSAPNTAGTFHVVATSKSDPSKSAIALVTVTTFSNSLSISTPRIWHTATRLQDGRVLITGGASTDGSNSSLQTAEIYDPSSGTFTGTGNMIAARKSHSATLLQDGRVLIAGGWSCSDQDCTDLQTADPVELYDPTTGTFTATGSMVSGHLAMNAILLDNGKVLFLAGNQQDGSATAEVYDPASGAFTIAGTGETFSGPIAVLLQNGMALVAGSVNSEVLPPELLRFEIFDPATGIYTLTNTSLSPYVQDGTTLTVLDNGAVLVAGGESDAGNHFTAGIYDPSTTTITATGDMTAPRGNIFTATLLADGKVLFAGGQWPGWNGVGSTEVYDPTSGAFSVTSPMTRGRFGHTATLLSTGDVLIAGGHTGGAPEDGGSVTATAELYSQE